MRAVEVRVYGHHLRLEPEAELEAALVRTLRHALQAALELLHVDNPVAERAVVVLTLAEPAVVKHHELDAEVFGTGREIVHLRIVEVKVRRLPVVDEDGAHGVAEFAAHDVVAHDLMEGLAHAIETFGAVSEQRLRRLERFARLQMPAELEGVDAADDARRAKLLDLRLERELSAPDEAEAVDLTALLTRVLAQECEERRCLMRARAAAARALLNAVHEWHALCRALGGMAAPEVHAVEIVVRQVEREARRIEQVHWLLAAVLEAGTARDDICIRKDRVRELSLELALGVGQRDLERLRLIVCCVRGRQARERRLAFRDGIVLVEELRRRRAVCKAHLIGWDAIVDMAVARVLLRQHVERERALIFIGTRLRREAAVELLERAAVAESPQFPAPVTVHEVAAADDLQHIAHLRIAQMEDACLFIKLDHMLIVSFPCVNQMPLK